MPPRRRTAGPALPVVVLCTALAAGNGAGLAQTSPIVTLTPDDLHRAGPGTAVASVTPPEPAPLPTVDPKATDAAAALLRDLIEDGAAAGLGGVLYDNRDRGHSSVPRRRFPALARLHYAPRLRKEGWDYGLARFVVPDAVVIGNSSTALTTKAVARSLPRAAMSGPYPTQNAVRPFYDNGLYVYPEHRDHDGEDRFPARWPYTVTTQGSSGSDRPFLDALLLALAALPPDTRERLERERLIAPTLQMLLRYGMEGIDGPQDYRTAAAHPPAFDAERLRPERMVRRANALRPDAIPPVPVIEVLSENFRDRAGLAQRSERLFDTPSAVARIWRDLAGRKRIVLSAARTRDPNGRELTFDWFVLHERNDLVRIEPLDSRGAVVEITIDWHDPYMTRIDEKHRSARMDVGLVVSNGVTDSAPAFLSVLFPHHQWRRYEEGPDGVPRPVEVDYRAGAPGPGFDPLLFWTAPWRDRFTYDEEGRLAGWTRIGEDGEKVRFDAAGRRADDGRPVAYRLARDPVFGPVLQGQVVPEPPAEAARGSPGGD